MLQGSAIDRLVQWHFRLLLTLRAVPAEVLLQEVGPLLVVVHIHTSTVDELFPSRDGGLCIRISEMKRVVAVVVNGIKDGSVLGLRGNNERLPAQNTGIPN
jgi:hypothetical protein